MGGNKVDDLKAVGLCQRRYGYRNGFFPVVLHAVCFALENVGEYKVPVLRFFYLQYFIYSLLIILQCPLGQLIVHIG